MIVTASLMMMCYFSATLGLSVIISISASKRSLDNILRKCNQYFVLRIKCKFLVRLFALKTTKQRTWTWSENRDSWWLWKISIDRPHRSDQDRHHKRYSIPAKSEIPLNNLIENYFLHTFHTFHTGKVTSNACAKWRKIRQCNILLISLRLRHVFAWCCMFWHLSIQGPVCS